MWSTCVFYFISPQYLKALSCSPFPSVTSVTLQWLTQDWYAVVICALQWCSVKISSIQIHGNEKFSTGGERKETENFFVCVWILHTIISGAFLAFPPTSANTRTLSYTSKTAHKLWAETHLEQCWQWPRESAVTLTSICQLDAVVCSPAIIFGFQNKYLSRLAKCVVLP